MEVFPFTKGVWFPSALTLARNKHENGHSINKTRGSNRKGDTGCNHRMMNNNYGRK